MKVLLSAVITVLLLLACAKQLTVEQQVIATLRNMEVAAEEGEQGEEEDLVERSESEDGDDDDDGDKAWNPPG